MADVCGHVVGVAACFGVAGAFAASGAVYSTRMKSRFVSPPPSTEIVGFTLVCLLGMVVIATALWLEWRRVKRGESLFGAKVFRWRAASGVVWLLILGTLSYAMWFLWPTSGDKIMARKFLSVLNGALLLMLLSFVLLYLDFVAVLRERRRQEKNLKRQMSDLVREAEKTRKE